MTKNEYNKRKVEEISKRYPGATVRVVERGGGKSAMTPGADEVLYIKSTGGTWGKSSEVRVGLAAARRAGKFPTRFPNMAGAREADKRAEKRGWVGG